MHITYFKQKVNNIRSHLTTTAVLTPQTADPPFEIVQPLGSFSDATQEEVEDIIKRMKPSTCALDPFPSTLLKANLPVVSPFITKIINLSLLVGHIPSALKTAVIRPLLKKPTMDPDVFSNYRPISNLSFLSKVLEKLLQHNFMFTSNTITCLKNFSRVSTLVIAQKQPWSGSPMTS